MKRKTALAQLWLFVCLLGFVHSTLAADTGKITGKVTDKKTGEALIGVTVVVQGTSTGAVTDVEGRYTLVTNVGSYTLDFKYMGYQTKSISDVAVNAGSPTSLDVIMDEPKSKDLKEVVIKGTYKQETINALYVAQKNNIAVSSGISADQIRRSPDKNTGEVLKRVSGTSIQDNKYVIVRGLTDRYNNATMNNVLLPSTEPDRKTFSFDIIPAGLIDNIVINKTASPDKPGDFAGGLVQVSTRDFPAEKFISVSAGVSVNSMSTFKDSKSGFRGKYDYWTFDDGSRKLPAGVTTQTAFNNLTGKAQDDVNRSFKNTWGTSNKKVAPGTNLQITLGDTKMLRGDQKFGYVLSLTSNHTERNEFAERNDYDIDNHVFKRHNIDTTNRYNSTLGAVANFAYSVKNTKISFKNIYNRILDNQTTLRSLATDPQPPFHYITQSSLSAMVERYLLSSTLQGEHGFGSNKKLEWMLNYSNTNRQDPDIRISNYTDSHAIVDQPVNGGTSRSFSKVNDNIYNGGASFLFPILKNTRQTLKLGVFEQYRSRTSNYRPLSYHRSFNFSYDSLALPPQLLFATGHLGSNGLYLRDDSSPENNYEANSNLSAGYFMFDNFITSKLRVIWGLRFESYRQKLQPVSTTGATVITTDTTYNSFLPSANVVYALTEKTNLRLSYSNTVARPEFREIASFSFYDFINSAAIFGNPKLKQTRINNVDLRYEIYPHAGETFAVSAFYKRFKDPISEIWYSIDNNDKTYVNLDDATVLGAELEVRKNLEFLLQKWGTNSFVFLNAAYIHSSIKNPENGAINGKTRPLPGQSPYLFNAGLQFNDPGNTMGLTILYNRIGQRINTVGDDSSNKLDVYENSRNLLDLQLSKRLFKNAAEIKFNISDIFNNPYLLYQNKDSKKAYKEGTDYIFYSYKLGTNYSLSFTYTFH
ncbi:outer membrane beta-barrel protein [Chitinophaga agrisoli]|uniref:Outer membrane beta-barrel protein n=1 Tax=Chitinophaga agrisoli TaxID=2607653 RepID=A0A5B2W136_9BACT|nr:TonB-dependent receptor [Chitinophaga agrisoli]KAA2244470.1 outer membrane beta-barrel protein [Chitinophaga agrisoli]